MRERVLSTATSNNVITNEPPLLEDCGIFTGGDGAPSYTFDMLSAEDPDTYKHVHNFNGGFHYLLNMHQKMGLKFGDTHLRDFLRPFRDSDSKKEWF